MKQSHISCSTFRGYLNELKNLTYIHSQNVWDKLQFLCELSFHETSPISTFQETFISSDESFILGYFLIFSYFLVSLFYSLLVMIALYFTCGEKKICSTMKKSQNIMNMILGGTCYLSDIFFIVYLHRKKVLPESDIFNLGQPAYLILVT